MDNDGVSLSLVGLIQPSQHVTIAPLWTKISNDQLEGRVERRSNFAESSERVPEDITRDTARTA